MAVVGGYKRFIRCLVHDIGKIGVVLFHLALLNLSTSRLLGWLLNGSQRKYAHCHEQ